LHHCAEILANALFFTFVKAFENTLKLRCDVL